MLVDYWCLQSTQTYLSWLNPIVQRIQLSGLPVSKKNMLWNKATSVLRLWLLGENHPIKNPETEVLAYTWGVNIQISFSSWTQPSGTLCSLIRKSIQIWLFASVSFNCLCYQILWLKQRHSQELLTIKVACLSHAVELWQLGGCCSASQWVSSHRSKGSAETGQTWRLFILAHYFCAVIYFSTHQNLI